MTSFLLSPAAVKDLAEIAEYIAAERPTAVNGVLDAIEAACGLVAVYPGVGRTRDEIDAEVKSFPMGAYILFYYIDENVVSIARILHASRDVGAVFHQQ